ncbi:MAG: NAD(P)-binding domain-containing protein, partial [Planctomycetes bacterium]|nr:NAD(P)-binding domain-containing protein [Planctomycetota bacterium]
MSDSSEHNPNKTHVTILGVGQMGLVCANVLALERAGPTAEVVMWGHSPDEIGRVAQTRRSDRLKGFVLPDSVRVELTDEQALAGADLIVSAVPVQFMRSVWERLRAHVPPGAGVVSVAKGIENETLLRPTQIIADVLGDDPDGLPRPLAALSGPTIASELARCMPATMAVASDDPAFADRVQKLFSTSWLRIYTNPDVLGVELAGA